MADPFPAAPPPQKALRHRPTRGGLEACLEFDALGLNLANALAGWAGGGGVLGRLGACSSRLAAAVARAPLALELTVEDEAAPLDCCIALHPERRALAAARRRGALAVLFAEDDVPAAKMRLVAERDARRGRRYTWHTL